MSGAARLSADGLFYWDGSRWISALSPDGRHRWDGTRWVPLAVAPAAAPPSLAFASPPIRAAAPRAIRVATSWTKPLQMAVAGLAAVQAVWYLIVPFWLAGPLTENVRRTAVSTPGALDPSQLSTVAILTLGATSVVLIAIATAVAIGALRRWIWMHYVVLALLGIGILDLPIAVANATGITPQVVPISGRLLVAQWVAASFSVVEIALFAWMLMALLRRGPWATRKKLSAQE